MATPLTLAAASGHEGTETSCISSAPSRIGRSHAGQTALDYAADQPRTTRMQLLRQRMIISKLPLCSPLSQVSHVSHVSRRTVEGGVSHLSRVSHRSQANFQPEAN